MFQFWYNDASLPKKCFFFICKDDGFIFFAALRNLCSVLHQPLQVQAVGNIVHGQSNITRWEDDAVRESFN